MTAEIEQIIAESMTFEIHSRAKLNLIWKQLNDSLKLEKDTKTSKWKDTVKLAKLEMEIQQSGSLLSTHLTQSLNLSGVQKFNYLRSFLDGEASHAISGLSLSNENYKEALDLLKNSYGNPQLILSAHMSTLVKLAKAESDNLHGLWRFYNNVESNVRSLRNLGIDNRSYESLLFPLIIEKIPRT